MGIAFRADVIGSMLRPGYLREARAALQAGELALDEFKRIEDRAVGQVIAMQEGSGVDVVTDGEMRRFVFMAPLTETVEGIEPVKGGTMPWHGPEGDVEWDFPAAVTGKLRKRRSLVTEEYSYARARLPLKATVPSPLLLMGL
jgi:5-methyltetrahydropteroyltriglutamate--homocysteine methyltransferase